MTTASISAHRHPAEGRWTPARRGFAAWRRKTALAARRFTDSASTLRSGVLHLAGLGLIDTAAFHLGSGAGLLTTGASVLVLEWLSSPDTD